MSKQTAVEWLVKEIYRDLVYDNNVKSLIDQAKQMEKEQVQNAFDEGVDWHRDYFGKQKGMVKNLPETYGGDNE
jgi:hypothetical protein